MPYLKPVSIPTKEISRSEGIVFKINNKYIQPFLDTHRYLLVYGGAGSGKSYFAAQKNIIRCLQKPGHNILVLRKVATTLRHSVFDLVTSLVYTIPGVLINRSDLNIVFPNGSRILFAGLDDPKKLKSIHDITSIWIEEATDITLNDFKEIDLRLRGNFDDYKQIIMTFNPIIATHWIKNYFFDLPSEYVRLNTAIYRFTYLDNIFIDDEYKQVLLDLQEQSPNLYRIYVLGDWGQLEDQIYSNWSVIDLSQEESDRLKENAVVGIDFGFNNPTAVLLVAIHDDCVYVLDEVYQNKLTNTDLIAILKEKFSVWGKHIIYPDVAEPDRIEELERHGFICGETDKDVLKGIRLLQTKKIFINKNCVNTIKEIQSYTWMKDKQGNTLEMPVKAFDHAMDALRYAVLGYYKGTSARVYIIGGM